MPRHAYVYSRLLVYAHSCMLTLAHSLHLSTHRAIKVWWHQELGLRRVNELAHGLKLSVKEILLRAEPGFGLEVLDQLMICPSFLCLLRNTATLLTFCIYAFRCRG